MNEGHTGGGDDEPTVRTGPALPGEAPGSPSRMRLVAETTAAQAAPLGDAAERVKGIDTTHWSGAAHDGFLYRRHELTRQWRSAHEIHTAVIERVGEHNGFVHELPHRWADYEDSRGNRLQLKNEHDDRTADLVRFLVEQAARLDELAVGESLRLAQRLEPAPAPAPQAPADDGPADEPEPGPVVAFEQRLRERELLTEALQHGRRVERIPYDGVTT
ncbi:hypothetical protein ACFWNN_19895 [Lentzea sp. NPDC058450]|uniref:hypothetical protein n=1 Tax=Lentzea sp. NPDC058450 TaxID=3346505 RepID=UPI003662FA69